MSSVLRLVFVGLSRRWPKLVPAVAVFAAIFLLCGLLPINGNLALAQSETAALNGIVSDQKGAVVPYVNVTATNVDTGVTAKSPTNEAGIYTFPNLPPGRYTLTVRKPGFKEIVVKELTLNVQDKAERNFSLEIGSVSETVTIKGGGININTSDGTVSTVVDRQFVENLPLNGRSFQSLLLLTPGVAAVANTVGINVVGGFSIDGQRAAANNFTVDGVSANFAASPGSFNNMQTSGNLPGLTVLGTTQSLASVDDLQEFRVQTSTYLPEFGPQPGGQISIVTRSGTNQFHGSGFEYARNDIFDANDWFANFKSPALLASNQLVHPPEHQNDFGGTFGGPLEIPHLYNGHDRTFFFFSYEGLRLLLPLSTPTEVPDMCLRGIAPATGPTSCATVGGVFTAGASPAAAGVLPFLNAFPIQNGAELGTGFATFNGTYSNPFTLNTTSLRIDHTINSKLTLFARYNRSPSSSITRATQDLAVVNHNSLKTQTATLGATWLPTPSTSNELRVNYSSNGAFSSPTQSSFSGSVPVARNLLVPTIYDSSTAQGSIFFSGAGFSVTGAALPNLTPIGNITSSQHLFNIVDGFSYARGSHRFKFGVDYRRLTPVIGPNTYITFAFFTAAFPTAAAPPSPQLVSGNPGTFELQAGIKIFPIFNETALYWEDVWKVTHRLTFDYGVRWDVIPSPGEANGHLQAALNQITDPTSIALAPLGTKQWKTTYNNFAPRLGVAYQLSQAPGHETVVRGGFGIFYDTGNDRATQNTARFPYAATAFVSGIHYPLVPSLIPPPTVPAVIPAPPATVVVPSNGAFFDPNLKLPYTLQWNVALEQSLGKNQALTVTYVGAAGRRLLQEEQENLSAIDKTGEFSSLNLTRNTATSDYDALQVQYQRRLSRGLQALASYTWSHSLDDDSDSGTGVIPVRGNASFDIRQIFAAAVTYDIPAPGNAALAHAVLGHWSLDSSFHYQSGAPVDLLATAINDPTTGALFIIRPNVVPGIPFYISQAACTANNGNVPCPGGRSFNNTKNDISAAQATAAGCVAPTATNVRGPFCTPTGTNGTLGRNYLRGLGAWQEDLAVRRQFKLTERVNLQLRGEAFNIFNHPDFGSISTSLSSATFGQPTNMLNTNLGGISSLYQIGGPRSLQLAVKVLF